MNVTKSLRRREFLKLGGVALASVTCPWLAPIAGQEDEAEEPLDVVEERTRNVLFFTKSSGYEHSVIKRKGENLGHAEKILTDLGEKFGFKVTATKDGRVFDGDLDGYDAFFFYTSGDLTKPGTDKQPPMSKKGKARLLQAIAGGKGFIGSHCAADTFHSKGDRFENQKKVDPYIAMLGGEFVRHGRQQEASMTPTGKDFPGMKAAVDGFRLKEEWYALKNFSRDIHVLLINETKGMIGKDYDRPAYPGTWARKHGKGRVFYTSMGHREDVWTNETFQAILLGGVVWTTGRVDAEVPANSRRVTPKCHVLPEM